MANKEERLARAWRATSNAGETARSENGNVFHKRQCVVNGENVD